MFALKDLVANGKGVRFLCLMADALWYESEDGFAFPVPLSETEGATFLAEDKALLFMRFIRKYLPVAGILESGLAKTLSVARGVRETVRFSHYKDGEMWFVTGEGFEFPVQVALKNATPVARVEDAVKFSGYAQRHREMLDAARIAA